MIGSKGIHSITSTLDNTNGSSYSSSRSDDVDISGMAWITGLLLLAF
jgi:hypothetical protein